MFNFGKKQYKEPKNLKEAVDLLKKLEKGFTGLSKELEDLKNKSQFSVQKVGIVRFNPFSEVGGDQSFSVVLLDGENNGVVVTSLYNREGNRVYGKPIQKGTSTYALSKEEKEAIDKARGNKNNTQ